MKISIVVAMGRNRAIGINGNLPWHLLADLQRFKKLTTGHTVIMGRKTHESIIKRLGRTLPNRVNIVISNTLALNLDIGGCIVIKSLGEALDIAKQDARQKEIFIIGGEQIYQSALPFTNRIYSTLVHGNFDGDAFFPILNHEEWEIVKSESHSQDSENLFSCDFIVLDRKEKKQKVVDPRFAKSKEYGGVIKKIASEGKCPFCPDNFKYHKNPILRKSKRWFLTKSSWPYDGAEHHFLIIGYEHKEKISQMHEDDWREIDSLAKWASSKFNLEGGALALRFGDTEYTGATVCHLHFHLIVPQKSKTVNFPIG